jgi:hypothetical protein
MQVDVAHPCFLDSSAATSRIKHNTATTTTPPSAPARKARFEGTFRSPPPLLWVSANCTCAYARLKVRDFSANMSRCGVKLLFHGPRCRWPKALCTGRMSSIMTISTLRPLAMGSGACAVNASHSNAYAVAPTSRSCSHNLQIRRHTWAFTCAVVRSFGPKTKPPPLVASALRREASNEDVPVTEAL